MARIGLCGDDPAIRRIVLAALEHADHEGVAAHDGREALRLFSTDDSLAVVIPRHRAAGPDGRDVCQALRSGAARAGPLPTALGRSMTAWPASAPAPTTTCRSPSTSWISSPASRRSPSADAWSPGPPPTSCSTPPSRAGVRRQSPADPTEFRMLAAAITSRPGEVVRRRAVGRRLAGRRRRQREHRRLLRPPDPRQARRGRVADAPADGARVGFRLT